MTTSKVGAVPIPGDHGAACLLPALATQYNDAEFSLQAYREIRMLGGR